MNATHRSTFKFHSVTREECNHCTITKDKRSKTLPNVHSCILSVTSPARGTCIQSSLVTTPPSVRNPSTVGPTHSALHKASEAPNRSARVILTSARHPEFSRARHFAGKTRQKKTTALGHGGDAGEGSHVFLKLLEVLVLLSELLLELQKLFFVSSQDGNPGWHLWVRGVRYLLLLTLADSEVLAGLLALRERVTVGVKWLAISLFFLFTACTQGGWSRLTFGRLLVEHRYHRQPWLARWWKRQLGIGVLGEQPLRWIGGAS